MCWHNWPWSARHSATPRRVCMAAGSRPFCLYLLAYQLLPYERAGDLLASLFGYQPGGGTLQKLLAEAYNALEPIEQAIQDAITANVTANAADPSQSNVSISYDARLLPIWNLYPPLPLPSDTIVYGATIRRGGL